MRFCVLLLLSSTLLSVSLGQHLACETRKPEGHTPVKTEGDGDFRIIVVGPQASRGLYAPNEVYTVTVQGLKTRYSTQYFMEFLLVAESEKQAMMGPTGLVTTGIFHIIDETRSRFSDVCPDAVTSVNRQPKSEISVLWTAPSVLVASCITFKASVVERPHVWYMDDGQLTHTLCPILDTGASNAKPTNPPPLPTQGSLLRQGSSRLRHGGFIRPTTELPTTTTTPSTSRSAVQVGTNSNSNNAQQGQTCCACDEAKYEVIFEGVWSKETHPKDFPENEWLLHFSDIIGASHSPEYSVWKAGEIASEGIRQVAEWGATRHLENELKAKSRSINTIIKARGLWHPNEREKTSAAFRVDRNRHLMSLVSMIGPSPDWIVGISDLQLCLANCTWLEDAQLDLFPFDAGTDSGITYMSPNTPTEPREKIHRLNATYPDDPRSPFYDPNGVLPPMKPFARVHIRRQRIYPKSCNDTSKTSDSSHEIYLSENTEDVNRPECAVTEWTSWSSCSVTCGKGLRMRKRNYLLPVKADMMRCDRQLVEKEMCLGNFPTCPPDDANFIEEVESICAVTQWSDWTPCSVSCGQGTRSRSRRYKNHMGRKKCNIETTQTESCRGVEEQCDPQPDVAECPMTPWSEWSPCSVSCGQGYQIRNRNFLPPDDITPLPPHCSAVELSERAPCIGEYGVDCRISMEEAKTLCILPLETGPCRADFVRFGFSPEKSMCVPFTYGGCKGNRNRFETPEECHSVCGFLNATPPPVRTTSPAAAAFPSRHLITTSPPVQVQVQIPDSGEDLLQLELSRNRWKTPEIVEEPKGSSPEVVDCVVSPWSEWSPCSASCGTGETLRSREIVVEPQNGGRRCPRKLRKRKPCQQPPC